MTDTDFKPCEKCRQSMAERGVRLDDQMSWAYLCTDCRRQRQELRKAADIRKATDPVAGAFGVRVGLNFEIDALREKIVCLFHLREEDLRDKVQNALEKATADENLEAMIEETVKMELASEFKRGLARAIQGAVQKRLGSAEWRKKIEERVAQEIEAEQRYGRG